MMLRRRTAAHVALALLAACTVESNERDEGDAPPSSPSTTVEQPGAPADTPAARPETRRDTLLVEGTAQPVELTLVGSPAGFPMPFSTYTTGDFLVEAAEGEGDGDPAVRFIAAFGGTRNDSAFFEIAAYPPGLTEAEAVARAERAVGPGGQPLDLADSGHEWAIRDWLLMRRAASGGWVLGFAALGRHDDRYFHVLARYPGDYGDGFGPRADLILEHWRWDDGAPLTPPNSP